jgi:hypothetical protein
VVLDPVYSGKAARGMVRDLARQPREGARSNGRAVVFVHTGGQLGLFAKEAQLAASLPAWTPGAPSSASSEEHARESACSILRARAPLDPVFMEG